MRYNGYTRYSSGGRSMTRAWEHGGKTPEQRGYGRKYRQQRAALLKREPLCRPCKAKGRVTAATQVDHIRSLAQGGAAYDPDNLQPICGPCHQDKCNADKGHRVKRRIQPDGWPEE